MCCNRYDPEGDHWVLTLGGGLNGSLSLFRQPLPLKTTSGRRFTDGSFVTWVYTVIRSLLNTWFSFTNVSAPFIVSVFWFELSLRWSGIRSPLMMGISTLNVSRKYFRTSQIFFMYSVILSFRSSLLIEYLLFGSFRLAWWWRIQVKIHGLVNLNFAESRIGSCVWSHSW